MPTFALFSAAIIVAILSTAYYRLYLHPLAKFPGPVLARLTVFPSYWHTLKGGTCSLVILTSMTEANSHKRPPRLALDSSARIW